MSTPEEIVPGVYGVGFLSAVGLLALLAGCGGPVGVAGTGAGSLPFDGRSPVEPPAKRMRVLVELRRPSLATRMRARKLDAAGQRAYVASLGDEARALESALEAKGVRLRRPVLLARVWNGFAATSTGDLQRPSTMPERSPVGSWRRS